MKRALRRCTDSEACRGMVHRICAKRLEAREEGCCRLCVGDTCLPGPAQVACGKLSEFTRTPMPTLHESLVARWRA